MTNNVEKKVKYTYEMFAKNAIEIATTLQDIEKEKNCNFGFNFENFISKANALIEQQLKKKEYNATHPKKSTSKGASEKTLATVAKIQPILKKGKNNAITGAEINAITGENFYALQIANAVKFIEGVQSIKVIRSTINSKGLRQEKEYTAYYLS